MAAAGKSAEEIAEVFGTKLETVRSWLAASRS
jgi:DNA-directed RNA polymerase specialized sigma24 family protein